MSAGDAVYAFFVREIAAASVVDTSGAEKWKDDIRKAVKMPDVDVHLVLEGEWEAPKLGSVAEGSQSCIKGIQRYFVARDLSSMSRGDFAREHLGDMKVEMMGLLVVLVRHSSLQVPHAETIETAPGETPEVEAIEKKGEVIKLAVMAHQDPSGPPKLVGEDASGSRFDLGDVTQPALLFVPRETLPYLKRNEDIWRRVKNPEATFDEGSSLRQAAGAEGGLLAALLAGPLMEGIEAENLSPGEFRINVVDTYADATIKLKGVGLFG